MNTTRRKTYCLVASQPMPKRKQPSEATRKRLPGRGTERRPSVFLLLMSLLPALIMFFPATIMVFLPGLHYPAIAADGRPDAAEASRSMSEQRATLSIEVMPDERVYANIDNRSQADVLRAMAGKNLFDIKGNLPAGEAVTLSFSGLTLSEALNKVLRGYNYVLLSQGPARKPVLTVLGKVERAKPTEQRVVASPSPVPAGQTPESGRSYVPPSMPEQPPAGRTPQAVPGAGRFARPAGPGLPSAVSPANQPPQPGSEASGRVPIAQGTERNAARPENDAPDDQLPRTKAQPQPGQASTGSEREDNAGDGSSAKVLLDGIEQRVEQK